MVSREELLPYYRVAREELGAFVAELSDREVLEFVSNEGVLTIPLRGQSGEARPLPHIEIGLENGFTRIALAYDGAEELRHLKNLTHPSQTDAQKEFNEAMRVLPPSFETRLYSRGFKESGFVFVKKYLAAKFDVGLLSTILVEIEGMRAGGRRIIDGRNVYAAPSTPLFYLLFTLVKADGIELRPVFSHMKRVLISVIGVKTQREIIHSRISKPVEQAGQYRGFVELLNKARGIAAISAEERRSLDKRWRDVPEERGAIEEDLRRRVGSTLGF